MRKFGKILYFSVPNIQKLVGNCQKVGSWLRADSCQLVDNCQMVGNLTQVEGCSCWQVVDGKHGQVVEPDSQVVLVGNQQFEVGNQLQVVGNH